MTDPGGIRASDAEREAVVERLREAAVEGRLTLQELTERTEAAYTATTRAELALLTADLPDGAPGPAPAAPAAPGGRRWYVAVLGDTRRRGKWRVDPAVGAVAVMGDITLDLREAEVTSSVIDIAVTVVMGSAKIVVPDGVHVDVGGVTIMGDRKIRVDEAAPGMNVPVVRIRAFVLMGDVKIIGDSRAEPVKRTWHAWHDHWLGMWQLERDQWRELGREIRRQWREGRRMFHHLTAPPPPPSPGAPPPPPPPASPPPPPPRPPEPPVR